MVEQSAGEKYTGEKSVGEKYVGETGMGEKSEGAKSVGEKSVAEKCTGESLWVKSIWLSSLGWKVYGWEVYWWRVSGWKVYWGKVYGWTVCGWKVYGWEVYGWKTLGEKSVGEKYMGEKSFWENRGRWDAGFRFPLLMFVPHNVMEPYGFIIVSFVPAAYFEGSVDDLDSFGGCLSMRCSFWFAQVGRSQSHLEIGGRRLQVTLATFEPNRNSTGRRCSFHGYTWLCWVTPV